MAKLFNIAEKRVAVLSLNLLGFHALCAPDRQATRAQRINEISTALLTMAVACAHSERGVMDSFHGDHFVLTFNASRAVAGPLAAAVRTANTFIQVVRSDPQLSGCVVAAGAASGRAQVGTFGIDGYRRMSVVGEAYRNATALQLAAVQFLRMNSHAGLDSGCLVDETALKELGSCPFHLQIVGCIQSSHTRTGQSEKQCRTAYFALDASSLNSVQDEWLYELDAMEATDPYTEPNRAMIALMGGSVAECRSIVDAHNNTQYALPPRLMGTTSSLSPGPSGSHDIASKPQ